MFNEIAKAFPNLQFTWIGDGELKYKLTNPNIIITGWKTREEVLKILNEQDIFILPSLWEGLPLSLLEAMYLKKICIVSNCIGNRDVIIHGKNGFISNNLEEYKINIKNISKNINVAQNAHEDILKRFDIGSMIKSYRKEYLK